MDRFQLNDYIHTYGYGMGMAQLLVWVWLSDYMDDFGIDPGGWLCDCAVIKSAHSADCKGHNHHQKTKLDF